MRPVTVAALHAELQTGTVELSEVQLVTTSGESIDLDVHTALSIFENHPDSTEIDFVSPPAEDPPVMAGPVTDVQPSTPEDQPASEPVTEIGVVGADAPVSSLDVSLKAQAAKANAEVPKGKKSAPLVDDADDAYDNPYAQDAE